MKSVLNSSLHLIALAGIAAAPAAFAAQQVTSTRSAPAFDVGQMARFDSPDDPANPYNQGASPAPMPEDARIVQFTFNQNEVYKVLTAPLKTTTIELGADEHLTSEPALGDSSRWEVDTDGKNLVTVKPHLPDTVNTISFSTNKHDYDFTVISSPAGGIFYQRVRFRYPESLLEKTEAIQAKLPQASASVAGPTNLPPDKMNWNYKISGTAPFRPTAVFDDGKFLWMRLPENAPMPVAWANEGGKQVVLNTIVRGEFLVVERLADDVVLAKDNQQVEITRPSRGFFGGW